MLPIDILRLILSEAQLPKLLGLFATSCKNYATAIQDSVDLWSSLLSFLIPPEISADQPRDVPFFRKLLRDASELKRRLVSGEANVVALEGQMEPYIRSTTGEGGRRGGSPRWHDADSSISWEIHKSRMGRHFILIQRVEEYGSSWSDRWVQSAKILSVDTPDEVLLDIDRMGEAQPFLDNTVYCISGRFLVQQEPGCIYQPSIEIYDALTSQVISVDIASLCGDAPTNDGAHSVTWVEEMAGRPWIIFHSCFPNQKDAVSTISIFDLENREACVQRLQVDTHLDSWRFYGDFAVATNFVTPSQTIIFRLVENELRAVTKLADWPGECVSVCSHSAFFVRGSPLGDRDGNFFEFYSLPSGSLQRSIHLPQYETVTAFLGSVCLVATSAGFAVHDLLAPVENSALVRFPGAVRDLVALPGNRFVGAGGSFLTLYDFETPFVPSRAFITCLASEKITFDRFHPKEALGHCHWVDVPAANLISHVASLLKCSIEAISVRLFSFYGATPGFVHIFPFSCASASNKISALL